MDDLTRETGAADEMSEQEILEQEIGELPVGYISKKNIHGKTRYYRQWTENGKIKSQYIREEELEEVQDQIARRKELQQRLKELNQKAKGAKRASSGGRGRGAGVMAFPEPDYETNVIVGEELLAMASNIQSNRKRDCYKELSGYLSGDCGERVCIVCGLRRTGKTTMIRQAILDMEPEEAKRAAYIKTTAADNMEVMNRDLRRLNQRGYRYVFIDEITLMDDFIDSAAILSDIYGAQGMRIVLTGTDSLAFALTMRQELFDRAVTVRTTFIPFREYSRLLGADSIDEYIRYGGTLRANRPSGTEGGEAGIMARVDGSNAKETFALFKDWDSTKDYIESAVCRNIQRSLAGSKDKSQFASLRALLDTGELIGAVNQIMEDMNLNFLLLVAADNPAFHEFRLAVWNMRNEKMRKEQADGLTKAHLAQIKEALVALDLVVECPAETTRPGTEPIEKVIFTQPGMRYCQVQTLVQELVNGDRFAPLSQVEKRELAERILMEVRGRMLEEMVLMETEKALSGRYQVFKMQLATGEFDMVVYDTEENNCTLCEVRGTNGAARNRFRRVPDAEKYRQIERRFGSIRERIMLCRDPQLMGNERGKYCRIEDYLRGLS